MRASLLAVSVRNLGGKGCGKGPRDLKKWLKSKMSLSMLLELEIRRALHCEYSDHLRFSNLAALYRRMYSNF